MSEGGREKETFGFVPRRISTPSRLIKANKLKLILIHSFLSLFDFETTFCYAIPGEWKGGLDEVVRRGVVR